MKYRLHPGAAHREVAGEFFVITADRALHQLTNPTAATIFRTLRDAAEPATLSAVAERLTHDFEVEQPRAIADTQTFLSTLIERQIVESVSD
ncbi:MAG: PqqD family protein [Myxococcales bacterium]|nr:PqqD family protein [Myxococcales bacterium]